MERRFSKAIAVGAQMLWLATMFVSGSAIADTANPARDDRMAQIEEARLRGNIDRLNALRERLEAELSSNESDSALRYDAAYTILRTLHLGRAHALSERAREEMLDRGLAHTAWLLERDPQNVEVSIVASALRGEAAERGMFARMREGRVAHGFASAAAEAAPDNPRARLQWGIILFFAPTMFGGGEDKALVEFEAARELFSKQEGVAPWPNWGALDSHAWLGRALAATGRTEEARATYLRALDRMPDYSWVRNFLLPELPPLSP